MQVWIPTFVDEKMPLLEKRHRSWYSDLAIENSNKRMQQLRGNFYYWLDWWDHSNPRTGTYESSVLNICLEYATTDLYNNIIR